MFLKVYVPESFKSKNGIALNGSGFFFRLVTVKIKEKVWREKLLKKCSLSMGMTRQPNTLSPGS